MGIAGYALKDRAIHLVNFKPTFSEIDPILQVWSKLTFHDSYINAYDRLCLIGIDIDQNFQIYSVVSQPILNSSFFNWSDRSGLVDTKLNI